MDLPPGPSSQRVIFTDRGAFLHHVAWSPPPDHSWKLSFAGYVADEDLGIAGTAFIIRDGDAIVKICCAIPVMFVQSIVMAELVALINGLKFAMSQGIECLELEGDCNSLFLLLDGLISAPLPMTHLLDDCLELLHGFRSVKLHCVRVISNQAANKLAVIAVTEREPCYWSVPPNAILKMLIDDVIGRWVPIDNV